jgi:hypothetical protein
MTNSENLARPREVVVSDLVRPIVIHRKLIGRAALVIVLVALLAGGLYFLLQPSIRSGRLEFRPLFQGVESGKYPNGLPFATSDIVNQSVVDVVFARNEVGQYCTADQFHSGFVVQQSSPELQFLNLEYQARLSDTRLTTVERQRLQDEYANRRLSIPIQYQLSFIQPSECARIPQAVVSKALGEVLETWATEAQDKRGVMKVRVPVLTPRLFDQPAAAGESLLVRADLLRTAVARVIRNIQEVEKLPGAELVKASEQEISLPEVRAELEDLIQARLDPLVAQAGGGLGRQASQWVEHAIETSTIRLHAAEQRAEAYRIALRDYSGISTSITPTGGSIPERQEGGSDVQALTPQIDRTFVDRILDLSALNTTFRQEITRNAIEAAEDVVERRALVDQYKALLASLTRNSGDQMTGAVVAGALDHITTQAKEATSRFNEIYAEFSRVSLRAGPAMYRMEQPVEFSSIRAFTFRDYASVVLGALVISPVVLSLFVLLQYHLRRLVGSTR